MKRKEVGERGERLARKHLERLGYAIIETNYRCGEGEIDIIARDGEVLVFVEVRARRSDTCGSAAESITDAKKARITAAAESYVQAHASPDTELRIDTVLITMDRGGRALAIEHLENAISGQ